MLLLIGNTNVRESCLHNYVNYRDFISMGDGNRGVRRGVLAVRITIFEVSDDIASE